MNVFWFIPTHGDSRYLGVTTGGRAVNLPYLQQVAQAVDSLGFTGALLPTGRSCEDAWVVASSLIPLTSRMKFLVAVMLVMFIHEFGHFVLMKRYGYNDKRMFFIPFMNMFLGDANNLY